MSTPHHARRWLLIMLALVATACGWAATPPGGATPSIADGQTDSVQSFWETWWFIASAVLILAGGVIGGYWLRVRNVEARSRKLEEQVADRTRHLAALNAVAAVTSQSLHIQETLTGALDKTLAVTGLEAGGIYLLNDDGQQLTIEAHRGLDETLVQAIDNLKVGEGFSGRVVQTGEPLVVRNIAADPRWTRLAVREVGFRAVAVVPLAARGRVLGTMFLISRSDREFPQQEMERLASTGRQIGMAIENARLFEAEERRAEHFKAISEVERHIASVLDPDELLAQIAGSIREAFNYYLVEIGLIEGDELVFKARAARNGESPFQSFRVKVGQEGITGWVAVAGEPLLVPDVSREPRFVKVTHHATRSELAVPIKAKDKVIGVINVQSDELEAFDEGDVAILQQLANQASVAIENARLFAQEQRRTEQFRVITEVGRRFALTLEITELLEQVVRLIQEAFGYYHVGIGLIEGDEVVYRVGAGVLWDDPQFQFRPGRLKVGQEGLTGWVAGQGQPLLAQDVSREPRYVWMQGSRTRSELVMPIIAKGQTIGVLDVQSDRLNAFDDKDVNVLQSLAHQAGAAIENARLYAAEQRRAEQFRVLTEVSQRITSILDIDELLAQVVRVIQRTFGYYYVEIGLIEGDELVFRVGAGDVWDDPQFQAKPSRLKVGTEGVSGRVAATGEALMAPDVSKEPRYIPVEGSQAQSELAVPISVKGNVIGVLDVESDRLNDFDDTDLHLITSLANQTGVAIENARLYAAEQRRAEQFRVLTEVSRRITSLASVDEILEQIAQLVHASFGYTHVGIGLVEGNEVVSKAEVGAFADAYRSIRIPLGQGSWGWVAEQGEPLRSSDIREDKHFYHMQETGRVRSHLCVPLRMKGEVIGVLSAASDRLNAFDDSDQVILQSVANLASTAIENARLYEQAQQLAVTEERSRLARDLHDSVTQALYGITLYSQAAAGHLASGRMDKVAEHLRELQDTSQDALAEMRLLIFELRPPILAEAGLAAALQARLLAVEGHAGLKTEFKSEMQGRLPLVIEEGLYRIAQEALNNCLKHARARRIVVKVWRDDPRVTLTIADDGVGFDPATARERGGLGLSAMAERAAQLGGRLNVNSKPGEGTEVRVEVCV